MKAQLTEPRVTRSFWISATLLRLYPDFAKDLSAAQALVYVGSAQPFPMSTGHAGVEYSCVGQPGYLRNKNNNDEEVE